MKIRNLHEYIKYFTNTNLSYPIGHEQEDAWLTYLYGASTSIKEWVSQVTSFAKNSIVQVFYEFLQNAEDSQSNKLFFFFDKQGILVINNGQPFRTDKKTTQPTQPGQLKSFLSKNKSDKKTYDTEQPNTIGKFGIGSKLLYNFFAFAEDENESNEKLLEKTLIDQLKGPILFSWNNISQWQNILDKKDFLFTLNSEFDDLDSPLLTKIIYTYYPVLPNEKQYVFNKDTEQLLFSYDEFMNFQNLLVKMVYEYQLLTHHLHRGTILFIPSTPNLNKQMQEKLLKSDFFSNVQISLALLRNVKYIQINEKIIRIEEVSKSFFVYDISKKPKCKIILPAPNKSFSSNSPNFFKYFPINNEVYHLPYALHSPEFITTQDRQNINEEDKKHQEIIQSIANALYEYILNINNSEEYIRLLDSLIQTDQNTQKSNLGSTFYDKLLEAMSQKLPAHNHSFYPKSQIFIKHENLQKSNIQPVDLGINAYWLKDVSKDFVANCKKKFALKEYSILDLLNHSELKHENLKDYFDSLYKKNTSEYEFLMGFVFENSNNNNTRKLPLVLCHDDCFYSIEEAFEPNTNIFLMTTELEFISPVLLKHNAKLSVFNLDKLPRNTTSKKLYSSESLFEKIINVLNPSSLTHDDKRNVFLFFSQKLGIKADKLSKELKIFTNKKGDTCSLSELISPKFLLPFPDLIQNFQHKADEPYFDEMETYYMSENKIWKLVFDHWQDIQFVLLKNYTPDTRKNIAVQFYDSIVILYQTSTSQTQNNIKKINCIIDENGHFVSPEQIFFVKSLFDNISEEDYQALAHWIRDNTDFYLLPFSSISIICQYYKTLGIKSANWKDIQDRMKQNYAVVTEPVLKMLHQISSQNFLEFVWITENQAGYEIHHKQQKKPQQYYADKVWQKFLSQYPNEYALLPEKLYSILKDDAYLKIGSEGFCSELIGIFKDNEQLLDIVLQQSNQIKQKYFTQFKQFHLNSEQEYEPEHFTIKFLSLCCEIDKIQDLKSITFLNGKSIHEYKYKDTVWIDKHRFKLHDLIPSYDAKSGAVSKIQKSLSKYIKNSQYEDLFNTDTELEPDQVIKHWRETPEKCNTIHQLSFLLLFIQHNNIQQCNLSQTIDYPCFNLKYQQLEELLENVFKYEIDSFRNSISALNFDFYDLNQVFLTRETSNEKYLLEKEKMPEPIQKWIEKGKKDEKCEFLEKASIKSDKTSPVIQLRKCILEANETKDIEKLAQEAIAYSENLINTFEYFYVSGQVKTKKIAENLNILIQEYIKQHKKVPPYLIFLVKYESNEPILEYQPLNAQETTVFRTTHYKDREKLNTFTAKNKAKVIYLNKDITDILNQILPNFLGELTINPEFLFDENIKNAQEWDSLNYQKCKEKYPEFNKKIMICNQPLLYEYYAQAPKMSKILLERDKGESVYLYKPQNIIFVYKEDEQKTILQILSEKGRYDKNLISEQELLWLYQEFEISEENQKIIETIEKNNISLQDIENFISQRNQATQTLPNVTTGTKGNIWLEEEQKKLVEKLFEKFSQDDLNELLDLNLDDIEQHRKKKKKKDKDEQEDDTTPNKITGIIGEVVAKYWYRNKFPTAKKVQIEDKSEYDIKVELDNVEIFVEVKTTSKNIFDTDGNLTKFYFRREQVSFMLKTKQKLNQKYVIFRFSFNGIEEFQKLANQYSELLAFVEGNGSEMEIFEALKNDVQQLCENNDIIDIIDGENNLVLIEFA